jgi:hypothetical protein
VLERCHNRGESLTHTFWKRLLLIVPLIRQQMQHTAVCVRPATAFPLRAQSAHMPAGVVLYSASLCADLAGVLALGCLPFSDDRMRTRVCPQTLCAGGLRLLLLLGGVFGLSQRTHARTCRGTSTCSCWSSKARAAVAGCHPAHSCCWVVCVLHCSASSACARTTVHQTDAAAAEGETGSG